MTSAAGPTRVVVWLAATAVSVSAGSSVAAAQAPPGPRLSGPRLLALGLPVPLRGEGAPARAPVAIDRLRHGTWRQVDAVTAGADGRFEASVAPRPASSRMTFRARLTPTSVSRPVLVGARAVRLDAVGDVNLGDGPGEAIVRRGPGYPWRFAGPILRRADLAVANLECAVSRRGAPQPKTFVFRGTARALLAAREAGGLDAVTLANNHSGDYGRTALLDTLRNARRAGLRTFGAARTEARARRARIVTRLGLRIGLIGMSDVNPPGFVARGRSPGSAAAGEAAVRRAVHRARRAGAHVVVVYFHWGIEGQFTSTARQRRLARAALRAGAQVVLGAHPHVLEPVVRHGRSVVAYSLGNFVFTPVRPGSGRTGILHVYLTRSGVAGVRLRRGHIAGTRPAFHG
jgi:poly-gamma-glutamate synthesis protein (capsule biosynthesis protein)